MQGMSHSERWKARACSREDGSKSPTSSLLQLSAAEHSHMYKSRALATRWVLRDPRPPYFSPNRPTLDPTQQKKLPATVLAMADPALPNEIVKSFLEQQARKSGRSKRRRGGGRWFLQGIIRGALGLFKLTALVGSGAAVVLLAKAHAERTMEGHVGAARARIQAEAGWL